MIIVCNFFNQTSKMKLSVAVLSSILLVCSVTIANPVVPSTTASTDHVSLTAAPSSTTSTESNPSATPITDGVNLDGLVSLSVDMKSLLKKIVKKQHVYTQQKIICEATEIKSYKQQKEVKLQEIKVEKSKNALLKNNGDLRYNVKLQEVERNLRNGNSKLAKLEKSEKECNIHCNRFLYELNLLREELLKYLFGDLWNSRPLDELLSRIDSHPVVREYLQGLCVGKSSKCKNSFGQDSGAKQTPQQEQQQITQELPVMPPESRSFGQRASSGIREGFSRLGDIHTP
ncbi:hypothetical protein BDEG_27417 [Batrachochytrium dendrobatidis JEL423]|uniref:Uncharacterized protein n=1 Tax=Batrachochytrium dendrobatidis (strain JEL423) TaxID=403673 RepID=A0A177WXC3_BATDL|nr:hypothetical protein BDEG_27417 [Batrachochytrium dendrobatidis JEL423]